MAGRNTRKAPAPSLMRYLPIALLIALIVFVGAVVSVFFFSPETGHYPLSENANGCTSGAVQGCSVGSCSGTSLCLSDGSWGGCDWQRVCTPGTKAPCFEDGCAYAYKTCNPCGSGYGACNSSKPAG